METKPDLTPVSEADRAAETALRERLARERPGEPVLGEEEGGDDASGWILDPDRRHLQLHARNPGLGDADRLCRPDRGRLRAGTGQAGGRARRGAFADSAPIRVSGVDRLEDATVLYGLDRPPPARAYEASGTCAASATSGRTCWSPKGPPTPPSTPGLAIWDWAPMKILVEEAGGRYDSSVSWNGRLDVSGLR